MFSTLLEGAAYLANVTNSPDNSSEIFSQFTPSLFQSSAELFIEAP